MGRGEAGGGRDAANGASSGGGGVAEVSRSGRTSDSGSAREGEPLGARDQLAVWVVGVLAGVLEGRQPHIEVDAVVAKAYQYADALLRERGRERPTACRGALCLCLGFQAAEGADGRAGA